MGTGVIKKVVSSGNTAPDKLMVVAHPDDEIIFGGKELIESQGWKVVVVTNADNPQRLREFIRTMTAVSADYEIWDCQDSFHCKEFQPDIRSELIALFETRYSRIVTHNLQGEYGHDQHRLLSELVYECCDQPFSVFSLAKTQAITPATLAKKKALLEYYPSQNHLFSDPNQTKSELEKTIQRTLEEYFEYGTTRDISLSERTEVRQKKAKTYFDRPELEQWWGTVPDRIHMKNIIYPAVGEFIKSRPSNHVLEVGAMDYNQNNRNLFLNDKIDYWVVEPHEQLPKMSCERFIRGYLQDLPQNHPETIGRFEAITCIGVLGCWEFSPEEIIAFTESLNQVLKPGGLLVLGWNTSTPTQFQPNLRLLHGYFRNAGVRGITKLEAIRNTARDSMIFASFIKRPAASQEIGNSLRIQ